ncbi:MAG: hypothetical protein MZV70_04705 [Desulfobacterales bacterium]|nr:hypothetical protein [Desulfobacterales bacterium]
MRRRSIARAAFSVHGGKVDCRITEDFGEDAADAHEDHGAEDGIAPDSQDEFGARSGHLLHQKRMGNIEKIFFHLPDGSAQSGMHP